MLRRPPRSTRTDTLFPYTTLFLSATVTIYRPPPFGISAPRDAVCLNAALTIRTSIDLSVWDIEWAKSTDSLNWTLTGIHETQITHPTSETGTAWYRLHALGRASGRERVCQYV